MDRNRWSLSIGITGRFGSDYADIKTILTTASIAAFVSASISGISLILNGYLERRSKKKEAFLKYSMELAKERNEIVWKVASTTESPAEFRDTIFLVEEYYKALENLDREGFLPHYLIEKEKKSKTE